MTMYGPSSAFIIVGARDLSSDTFQLEEAIEQMFEETQGLGTSWIEQKPIGLAKVSLAASGGLYDDRVGGNVEALQAAGETDQQVCYGLSGRTNGDSVALLFGTYASKWKRIASRDGLTKAHAEYTVTGRLLRARILHALSAETTDPGNSEGASVDQNTSKLASVRHIASNTLANPTVVTTLEDHNLITGDIIFVSGSNSTPTIDGARTVTVTGAKTFTVPVNVTVAGTAGTFLNMTSTNGVADLHVSALTLGGYTNLTVKVRHSLDNITFADLATFTAATVAPFANRQTITGTINRYTAVSWDFIGAGSGQSATFLVALCRDNG